MPGAPLCAACKRDPSRKLVTLSQSLALGYTLAALRSIGAACRTPTSIFFLESKLLAAARSNPEFFAPEAARADVARLRRERRAARPALDATRATLMRDPSLFPWRDGAHVSAVQSGLLSRRQAVGLARAAAGAWLFLSRPDVRAGHACSKREVQAAFDACVLGRLGIRLLHFVGRCSSPDVAPRAVCVEVVNRVLRPIGVGEPTVCLLWGARCVQWTPRDHAYVCDGATRRVVREVLLHLCRHFGLAAGSEVVKRVFAFVFMPTSTAEPVEDGGRQEAPVGDAFFGDETALELRPAPVGPSPCVAPAPQQPRVRFAFLLQHGDAHEGRTCAN